jgi:thioredoxin-like negative regulator of GroEL
MNLAYIVIFFIIAIICVGIIYYLYKPSTHKFVPNNEYTAGETSEIQLILFYVTWCPHSQDALTKWNDMQANIITGNPNYIIDFSTVDCEKYSEIAKSFKITEYPTIYLVSGVNKFEYDANLNEDTLHIFINTVMNK